MPGMDGFQVAETLKASGDNACTVLMVASSQFGGHVGRALDIGIGAYLIKPVKRAELIKAINVALCPRRPPSAGPRLSPRSVQV